MHMQLPDFSKAHILVIGDVMLDRYWFGDTARISPEAPVPVVNIKQNDERPGGAGNVALNIAALGAKVTLLGIAGADEAGESLKRQLSVAGIQHEIIPLQGVPTITKLRVMSRHQQLIRLDFEEKIPSSSHSTLMDAYKKHLNHANLVILSDYGKGTLSCSKELIALAKAANIPVFVDPKGQDFSAYQGATAITPNFKEFETIVGVCENEQTILHKAQSFLTTFGIKNLLLTRGERGMTLIRNDAEEIHLPAHAREVYDVTGAGDTVIAVLAAAYAAGETLPKAMKLANLAASLVVAKLGAAAVSDGELQAALHTSEHTIPQGVVNEEQLLSAVTSAKLQGKKIVFTNGCFDILHAGHVTYLQQAKQLGDYLVVAINDDISVKQLKGTGRPINHVAQRMAVLASLGVVDLVTSFADPTPERLLKAIQPHILVKGGDYTPDQVVGHEIVHAYGGEVRVLGVVKNISTSLMIERIKNRYSHDHIR